MPGVFQMYFEKDDVRQKSKNTLDCIGNTPLVKLNKIVPENCADIFVKLEYFNPTGSKKDRMALAMIEGAEKKDLLKQGMKVVELSGGSTGAGLALQMKRTDVSQTEFLDMFGINPDGTFEKTGLKGKTTDFDGALRQMVIQAATTLAVTELTSNGNASNRLNDGLSQGLYSKAPKTPELTKVIKKIVESQGTGDTDALINDLIENYGVSPENAELLTSMLRDQALKNFLQAPGGYNEFVMKFFANDKDIAKMFQATKKGDKFRNIVDKFIKVEGYSDKGIPSKELLGLTLLSLHNLTHLIRFTGAMRQAIIEGCFSEDFAPWQSDSKARHTW